LRNFPRKIFTEDTIPDFEITVRDQFGNLLNRNDFEIRVIGESIDLPASSGRKKAPQFLSFKIIDGNVLKERKKETIKKQNKHKHRSLQIEWNQNQTHKH